tara:strand:- start:27378 stop:27716 length:339 start_codon:yes stop_codon:yes gene_type:complete
MSFLTRESRTRLAIDIESLRSTLPRPTSSTALQNTVKMMSSLEPLNEAQRGRVAATHVQLFDENQQLRAMLAATNIGVERIVATLRDGHAARKRSPSLMKNQNVSRKKRRRI